MTMVTQSPAPYILPYSTLPYYPTLPYPMPYTCTYITLYLISIPIPYTYFFLTFYLPYLTLPYPTTLPYAYPYLPYPTLLYTLFNLTLKPLDQFTSNFQVTFRFTQLTI